MSSRASQQMSMKIGQVARASGVSVETLRYYERLGLLDAAERAPYSNYRTFPPSTVRSLRFIRRVQNLGFSLAEIKELLELRTSRGARAIEVRTTVERKLAAVRHKIRDLKRIKSSLERLSESCDGRGAVGHCAILDALDSDAPDESDA